jgi:dipeptidyl aminopeptidase/acylaminoacyl peptidase
MRASDRRGPAGAALLALLLPAALAAQDTTGASATGAGNATPRRAFAPADVYRVVTVASPTVSPDGRLVAFTVRRVDEQRNRRRTEVWTVPTAGGEPARLSWPDSESTAPYFLPDGRLAFLAGGGAGGRARTYVVRPGEPGAQPVLARTLPPPDASWTRDGRVAVWTDSTGGASGAALPARPDSSMRDPLAPDSARQDTSRAARAARGAAAARAPFGAVTRPLDRARFDGRHYVDLPYKSNDLGFLANPASPRRWNPLQLWTAAASDTVRRQLTTGAYSHREAAVSPDGRAVAFVADSALRPDSAAEAERDSLARLPFDRRREEIERTEGDIFVRDLAGGEPRRVATMPGAKSKLAWSPDGRTIAFLWRPARTKSLTLATVDVQTGRVRDLLGDVAWEPEGFEWLSNLLLGVHAPVGGRTALFRVGTGGGGVREVLGGRRRLSGFAFDRDRRTVAYVATSMTRPTELYVASSDGTGERALTSFNAPLLREVAMQDAERFTYRSVGGQDIEGWLMRPFGYDSARRHPLVLYIHGGPHSAYGENWFDEFQNLAGAGMAVLFTNPRGSSGYGAAFTYVTRGRWGMEDYQDLMKAVDLAAARADVDSTRMGVTGGSYGGFMTAWITTKTNRFKAAQVDRMISDFTYWYGASDVQAFAEFEFLGAPWENQPLYDNLSPIRWVKNVRTPTLLVQSEDDHRTPMGNAELWFTALRRRGVPAEFVRYPRSTHELSRSGEPWLLVDRLGRLRQWFGYWLAEGGPTRTAAGR